MELNEIEDNIRTATAPAFRDRLLAKGQARSMIWRNGELPEDAPRFPGGLTYDLRSYAYSLLSLALQFRAEGRDSSLTRTAFEHAANALESTVSGGSPDEPDRGFHRLLAACAFHLGRFSARAFSLLSNVLDRSNFSEMERALALFILRSFDDLDAAIVNYMRDTASDDSMATSLAQSTIAEVTSDSNSDDNSVTLSALDAVLTESFMRALGTYLSALETGITRLASEARNALQGSLDICSEMNLVPQWWCHRLAIHILDDLWSATFHTLLPKEPPHADANQWRAIRDLFIALLVKRKRAEVELWPSQIEAARRAVDTHDDLVVSLPTSAGKTRVAELCILRTLAAGKRIVFVTPLRALSAQTEASLQRTFGPLGKTISTLYGSIGASPFDSDALEKRDIVVATPEKLDFALRNDPSLI